MSIRVEVVCIADDGSEQRWAVMTIEGRELAMETLGLTLGQSLACGRAGFRGRTTRAPVSGPTADVSSMRPTAQSPSKSRGSVLEVVAKSGGPAEDIRFETSPSSVKPYLF